jgi:hypothetical protein
MIHSTAKAGNEIILKKHDERAYRPQTFRFCTIQGIFWTSWNLKFVKDSSPGII